MMPRPRIFRFIRVLLLLIFAAGAAHAATHEVRSAREVESLLGSRKLSPGDTVVWADGEYAGEVLNIDRVDGTDARPITLRAATPGGVILRGKSSFTIGVRWWVVEGFHFDGGSGGPNSYNTFQFRSRSGTTAQHVRLTNCAMTNLAVAEGSAKWVLIHGRFNTIDHCHFSGKRNKGALVTVELGSLGAKETAEHRLAWNYFGDFAPQSGTDNETIRVGFSGDQNKPATCVIERNLFVRCDGENEIISNKSSFNTYYANTFRQCNGALVLRHGHHARVDSNFFFGEGAENAGGIRVVDSNHVIINNYMQDLTGATWNAAFSIVGGQQSSGGSGNGYQAVDDILVAHNSLINCQRSIFFNDAKESRAPSGTMANNLVSSTAAPLILEKIPTSGMKWVGNLLHGAEVGAAVECLTADPELRSADGLLRPSPAGSAANAAVDIDVEVPKDIDGQGRPTSQKDIGADEVAGADGDISLAPLSTADVGVSFLGGGPNDASNRDSSPSSSPERQSRTQEVLVPAETPGDLLDLSCWKLTLPIDTDRPGRPDEIHPPELKSFVEQQCFFVNEKTKSVVFRAPCGGATTKGSKYPRCELRETSDRGKSLAAWDTDDDRVHAMTMTAAILQLPPVKKHVVCAQIHDADNDVLMVRLEGEKLFIERNDAGDVLLERNYKLGTPFEMKIQAGDGRIQVWHNGHLKMSWERSLKGCYFKAGCYTQSNPDKGDAADSYGEVEISQLQVSHQPQP